MEFESNCYFSRISRELYDTALEDRICVAARLPCQIFLGVHKYSDAERTSTPSIYEYDTLPANFTFPLFLPSEATRIVAHGDKRARGLFLVTSKRNKLWNDKLPFLLVKD